MIGGEVKPYSLFEMIRQTHAHNPKGVLSAYKDNAAVVEGHRGRRFFAQGEGRIYGYVEEPVDLLMKVETHNHPTAIAPYPGASTGAGGEIRDEAATGRGACTKAGLTGFSVSNLHLPGRPRPWEIPYGRPARLASALQIMIEGPLGAAGFNNEFGRPALAGYFRTYEQLVGGEVRGYHKPIMLAGGMGNIRRAHVEKQRIAPGASLIVLGGPAMLLGLGGGAASSLDSGAGDEALDFASVQRDNPEMQRRCQEVINYCWQLGADNPIISIHDVGAGGLANALPELVHDSKRGARLALRKIPCDDPGMSPLEIWCNEAQERYVLAVAAEDVERFAAICAREHCPYAVVGETTGEEHLRLDDELFDNRPIDLPMDVLFGKTPRMRRTVEARAPAVPSGQTSQLHALEPREALYRMLQLPTVADKSFLITIGDRTVGGLSARDQMVGPWQVPVSDCAATCLGYTGYAGEAMALGERAPVALLNPAASARMAVGEALTNLAAAGIADTAGVRLSANWMVAAGHPGDEAGLYEAVEAIARGLCRQLDIAIPVGKDSMSMRTVWQAQGEQRSVTAPLSLVVSAFAPIADVRQVLTPTLRLDSGESELILIDLGRGRLGGSALAQVHSLLGEEAPDVDDAGALRSMVRAVGELAVKGRLLAYHDRSDGGLAVTLLEMAFAGRCGLDIGLPGADAPIPALFAEELGAVIQVRSADLADVLGVLRTFGLEGRCHRIGRPVPGSRIRITQGDRVVLEDNRVALHRIWSETSFAMQALRDNPACAQEEYDRLLDESDPGLHSRLTFDPDADPAAPMIAKSRPRVAVLREQGVNGHVEMAAAFDRAGFDAVDVHMNDLLCGRQRLTDFQGLAACGGFSYGDVLGAGGGWAKRVLFNPTLKAGFVDFFAREDTFALGVCNGCQMLAQLKEIIPGADHWPRFLGNRSERFEARLVMVEVTESPSVLLEGMAGSRLPVPVAHGEGRAVFDEGVDPTVAGACLRYVDNRGAASEVYPFNPNGSIGGWNGFTSRDGRVTLMMPHPERAVRSVTYSWRPPDWGADGPWLRLFRNARRWVG